MGTSYKMENPWLKKFPVVGKYEKYCLDSEQDIIREFNENEERRQKNAADKKDKHGSKDYKIRETVRPFSFSANIKECEIVVLALNPGYDPKNDKYENELTEWPKIKNAIEILIDRADALSNKYEDYWEKRWKWVAAELGPDGYDVINKKVALMQFFPYHSTNFKELPKNLMKKYVRREMDVISEILGEGEKENVKSDSRWLPSQKYAFDLLKERLRNNPGLLVICTRSKKLWKDAIVDDDGKSLFADEYFITTNSYQNTALSPGNLKPEHWRKIIDKLRSA